MTSIDLYSISGLNYPYTVYVCDIYGNQCILVSVISSNVPPVNTILLPPLFNNAPAVGIKVVTTDGCERFKIFDCVNVYKQFQDLELFDFMDGIQYDFQ
jgi:hypothetical protein